MNEKYLCLPPGLALHIPYSCCLSISRNASHQIQIITSMLPLIFLFFFFCSVDVTTSFPADADLSNCTQNFECGPFRNLTYPFTGGARPSYCGPPEFHLSCIDDTPELTIAALSYRVLKLDPVHQNLTLARSDLWNSTCTDKLGNSTLESEFFTYDDDDDMDVTIFYGCNSTLITPKPENWFFCDLNLTFDDAYYVIGPAPLDPIMSGFKCSVGITVPILKTTAAVLVGNRSLFGEAIKTGFNVHYTNPYEKQCAKCLNVNGLCGFDSDKNRPVCICGNRVCNPAGTMDNGNFVVKDDIGADQLLYQSFDHLCDTLLRSQLLGYGINSGTRTAMTSWKSESDPSTARLQDLTHMQVGFKVPDSHEFVSLDSDSTSADCKTVRLNNCSYKAYALVYKIGCLIWSKHLTHMQEFPSDSVDVYIRLACTELADELMILVLDAFFSFFFFLFNSA